MENKPLKEKLPAIPTTYMPDDWREKGATHFGCSKNKIERIVYGLMPHPNTRIYEFMLAMAEKGKKDYDVKQEEFSNRVAALSNV